MIMKKCLMFLCGFAFITTAMATNISPVGVWATISDKTDKARSLIQITKNKGELYGKVIKIFKEPDDIGICKECPGKFKDKKIDGMTILWGLRRTGAREWRYGKILDPKSGSIYSAEIHVAPNGKSLEIRGYLGISLFGRSQTWIREADYKASKK